jgi:nucleoside-diphosphate-sugar epimerase
VIRALITGGAGFIGSALVRGLLDSGHEVLILDDLSTGSRGNLEGVEVRLVEGDVRDPDAVREAAAGAEVVFHLAALPSVARSVVDPVTAHRVNVDGTVNVLIAARDAGARRLVYTSSSSVYGDTPTLPKHEDMPVQPRSPYAAAKLAGEAYCRAFDASFDLETVSLRPFNVFGPRQDPDSPYAAVIPRFVTAMRAGQQPEIFGDGRQSRDFTYVVNMVAALLLAADAGPEAAGEVMNVGSGGRTSLLELVSALNELLGTDLAPVFADPRPGDVRDSEASVEKAGRLIGYRPNVGIREGLDQTVRWLSERLTPEVLNR